MNNACEIWAALMGCCEQETQRLDREGQRRELEAGAEAQRFTPSRPQPQRTPARPTTPPVVRAAVRDEPFIPAVPVWDSPQWYSGAVPDGAGGWTWETDGPAPQEQPRYVVIWHDKGQYIERTQVVREQPPATPPAPGELVAYVSQREQEPGGPLSLLSLEGQEPLPRLLTRQDYAAAAGSSAQTVGYEWAGPENWRDLLGTAEQPLDMTRPAADLEADGWTWVAGPLHTLRPTALRWQRPDPVPVPQTTDRLIGSGVTAQGQPVQVELLAEDMTDRLTPERFRAGLVVDVPLADGSVTETLTEYRVCLRVDVAGNWLLLLQGRARADVLPPLTHADQPEQTEHRWRLDLGLVGALDLYAPPTPWIDVRLLEVSQQDVALPFEDLTVSTEWREWAEAQVNVVEVQLDLIRDRWDGLGYAGRMDVLRRYKPYDVHMERAWRITAGQARDPLWRWRVREQEMELGALERFRSPDGSVVVTGRPTVQQATLEEGAELRAWGRTLSGGSWTALRDNPRRQGEGWDFSPAYLLHLADDGTVTRVDRDGGTTSVSRELFSREVLRLTEGQMMGFQAGALEYPDWPPQRAAVETDVLYAPHIVMAHEPWRDAIKAPPPAGHPAHWYWPERPGRPPATLPDTAPRAPLGTVLADIGAPEPKHAAGEHPLKPLTALAYQTPEGTWAATPPPTANQLFQPAAAPDTRAPRAPGQSAVWRLRWPVPPPEAGQVRTLHLLLRVKEAALAEPLTVSVAGQGLTATCLPQGRNVQARGWQPYLVRVMSDEGTVPEELTLAFSRSIQPADWLALPLISQQIISF